MNSIVLSKSSVSIVSVVFGNVLFLLNPSKLLQLSYSISCF